MVLHTLLTCCDRLRNVADHFISVRRNKNEEKNVFFTDTGLPISYFYKRNY